MDGEYPGAELRWEVQEIEQGLYFHISLPRIAAQRANGALGRRLAPSGVRLEALKTGPIPSGWVELRPRLSGVCGSDISLLRGQSSPYMAPLTSFPAVLGHEIVATVEGSGQRVVVEPSLSCAARRLPPCQMCSTGHPDDCLRRSDPGLGPGLLLGYNARMPGGWSHKMWAPEEQLVPVPEAMPDERSVLTEPAAIVLAGLRRLEWASVETVLVIGAGTLGLLAIALISELYPAATLFTQARYPRQRELARRFGADHVVQRPDTDTEFRRMVGDPSPTMPGFAPYYPRGFDAVVVAAGSGTALSDGLRWVAADGQVLLLGGVGSVRTDWTPVWSRRIRLQGSYGYGESGVDTFRAVLSLFSVMSQPLEELVTHRFSLSEYRTAIHALMGGQGVIKAVFAP